MRSLPHTSPMAAQRSRVLLRGPSRLARGAALPVSIFLSLSLSLSLSPCRAFSLSSLSALLDVRRTPSGSCTDRPHKAWEERRCQRELERLREWHASLVPGRGISQAAAHEGVEVQHTRQRQAQGELVRGRRLLEVEAAEGGEEGEGKAAQGVEEGEGKVAQGGEEGEGKEPEGGEEGEGKAAEGADTDPAKPVNLDLEWRPDRKVVRNFEELTEENMHEILVSQKEELQKVAAEVEEMKAELQKLTHIKSMQDLNITIFRPDFSESLLTPKLLEEARSLIQKCNGKGWILSKPTPTWKGYSCSADDETISKYLSYPDRGACPDDWPITQKMIFVDSCFALPKRRCLNPTSSSWQEPVPFPQSLFDQDALIDRNVRWDQHGCKSFDCLNSRLIGDCRNCFNMKLESRRWRRAYRGSLPMKDVIALKNGTLRIGLDAGGGSGSFAAHMALHGVTVMTTAMNIETIKGRDSGLPYMETIALRGLVPLHVPHKSRLPFFDNTLDVIHCVNSVKYLPMLEFEELLFEWDRVLRVGGVMWFEMFYAPMDEMPIYVALIEQLGYKKLHWNVLPKPDYGERKGIHVYLNCVIEKPVRKDPRGWFV